MDIFNIIETAGDILYNSWYEWYDIILDDFSFSKDEDVVSATLLDEKISKTGKYDLSHISLSSQSIVFGAGPSIKKHISFLKDNVDLNKYNLIAADGATTALLEEDIIPDIIVTDLDGNMEDIIKSNELGSILYVHAHGDNIEKINQYFDKLDKIIPTCQCEAFGNLENYGGFTDGDRAVHIAVYSLNSRKIILAGMDFGNVITKYSRPEISTKIQKADTFKEKKLIYAKKLIDSLKKDNIQIELINLNDSIQIP